MPRGYRAFEQYSPHLPAAAKWTPKMAQHHMHSYLCEDYKSTGRLTHVGLFPFHKRTNQDTKIQKVHEAYKN